MPLDLTSSAFSNGNPIPDQYSKQGGNISPPLTWSGAPEMTASFALIVDDPDAPSGLFDHWLIYGIPPDVHALQEHQSAEGNLPNGARQGVNGYGDLGYGGPQPPSGTHRYFFHLYALDTISTLPAGLSREELEMEIDGHILDEVQLMGTYQHRGSTRAA